jgi:acyl carrier protein
MSDSSKVRELIVENFLFGDGKSLKEDTSFLEEGVVDSMGVLERIAFLEETYGIKIEDEELVPEYMDTLQNIARFLDKKLRRSAAAET